MKYLRRQNLNTGNILDDTVLQRADGNIEFNPTQKVVINGDLEFGAGFAIPGPEVTNIIYVTLDGNDDNSGLGEGAQQAKRTLKSALEAADQGTTIFVRSGEYYEDNPLRVPPKVSIIGDNLRRTIIRPLNGPQSADVTYAEKTDEYVTLTTSAPHGLNVGDRIRVRVQLGLVVNAGSFIEGRTYKVLTSGDTNFTVIGAASNNVNEVFTATASGAGTGTAIWIEVDETDVNIFDIPSDDTLVFRQPGFDIAGTVASGKIKWAPDLFLVNSQNYLTGMVFKGLAAPAYCVNIDDDAIVDTSPYVQNCSNINGPWMRNGVEWLPFITEQPDLAGNPVSGPRPLLDNEIDPTQVHLYGIDDEGAGGGMLIDGDRYSSESPIKSMVGDAFTQVSQGGIGFHITNFGYMQLVSCFAVFCKRAFFTTRGGYLSVSNSVIDFGDEGFTADGYYPDPYGSGLITQNYYSSIASISVTPGEGYTSQPSILIDPPTTPGGVQALAEASIDPILGIVNGVTITEPGSGYDFQPSVTISGGGASVNAIGVANLQKNLYVDVAELSNKPQIGSVMFLGNDEQSYYVTDVSNTSFTFKYDEQKCRRDVGIILDAVLADMLFGSTHRSVSAGLSYLRSYSSKVTSLQKSQTIAGLTEAKNQALAIATDSVAQTRIQTGFDTVINIINFGTSVAPLIVNPLPPSYEPGYPQAAAILLANKTFLKDEIVSWIGNNFPMLSYNEATCKRDIGYIIDAMCYDMTYGGNTQTINAALAYKEGSVIINEIEETQAAYEYWKTIVGNVVKNIPVVTTTLGQNTSLPLGSPVDPNGPKTVAEELLQIIIDVVDNGPGYIPELATQPNYSIGNPTLLAERNLVIADTTTIQEFVINYLNNLYGGGARVYTFPPITAVTTGVEPRFYNVSTISTSSTALEYVGSGVTYNSLPFFGGEPIPAKERIERDSGKCFTVSSDQIGNYRIGEFFTVNSLTGEVTIDAEKLNLSGLASIGPFRRNGIPVGVQLREVSNNANLIASNGIADSNTVPTQPAVQTYVENRYLNKIGTSAQTINSKITFNDDIGVNGGDFYSTSTTFNLLNRDSAASIGEDGPTTVNAFLNATAVNIGASTGTTSIKNDLEVRGQLINTTQTSINLFNTSATTVNAFGAATDINVGAATGTADFNNSTINFPNATNININGVNPTIATTSTGTLTLFDTLVTTINAFRAATTINIGESTGTITLRGASTITDGDLQVKGGDLTTNQTTFNLLNATATTVNAFGAATTIGIGAGSGTTTVKNNLQVNLNSTLGVDATSANILWGVLTANIRDNNTNSFEIKEATNSYFKIDTSNSNELTSFGSISKVLFNNVLDASSTSVASAVFSGGVGIAKKLYVGTDFNLAGNAMLGNDRAVDTHTVNGTVSVNVPDNTAIAFQITENTQTYLTAVTTNGSESITIEATPKLLIKNTTDSSTKDTGAVIIEGGVGVEKNLTVGVDLKVDRDITATGDLSVNGGDLTTTAATFNLLNTNATTLNFAGAGTAISIGAATGTTTVKHNLDVDGDVNIDGGDLTVSTATFNLANTNATTGNLFGAATAVTVGTNAATASSLTFGPAITANTFKIGSTAAGTINLTTDVTSGIVNEWQSVTGTINIGASGTINLGTAAAATTTVDIGGAITGNTLKISGTAAGTVNLTSDVTSGTVNAFTGTTGTINIGGQGVVANIGTTAGNSILEIRGSSTTGTATIRTSSGVTTAAVFNTVATTGNLFGAATTVSIGAATGTTTINNANTVVTGDLAVNGGDITSTATTFNLLNSTVTTGNLFGAGTTVSIGAATGNTTVNNNLIVSGDAQIKGGDLTVDAATTTFNLITTNASTVNAFGAATDVQIGAATGTTNINHNLDVDGDVNIDGGDLTVSTATFNIANTTATTVNAFGAATTIEIGAATGTTNINNNLDVDGDVNIDGGDLTVSTATFNIANTTATTVNAFGAATGLVLAAITGTTNIRNNLDVDGNINVDGGDITTSAGTFNLANTIATTVNAFGAATAINIGFASPTGLTTVKHDLKVDGDLTVDGTLNLGNDVTIAGDLAINGGDLTTTATTFNLLNATATTINFGNAATTIEIGAATGTTNINNNLDVDGDINFDGGDITSSAVTVNLLAATSTTVNAFGAATALNLGAATGTTIVKNNFEVDLNTVLNGTLTVDLGATVTGDLGVNGGDLTTSSATFNLINANATTVNFAGAATDVQIGAATGTTNVNNNLDVDGDVNIDGGDLTVSTATFNLANTTATTGNLFGAATTINVGAAGSAGTLTIKNDNVVLDGDLQVKGGDLTTTQTTFNLLNATATTVNFAGAATNVQIGAATGTTNVNNNLDVDGDVNIDGGDLTVSTATFNLANTTATTVNFAGAATDVQIGAATGTTNVNNNLDVDGDVNIDGGDLTASGTSFNLVNTNITTGNLFGAATTVNVGTSAASASTLNFGPAITGNTFKLASVAAGTVNYSTDVTSGIVNAWQSVTGTVNIGKSGTINIGNSTTATTAAVVGGAFTGNSLKIAGTAAGTVTLSSDVTTGTVNVFNNITTGTVNVAGAGASIINLGGTGSTVNIKTLTLTTDLEVQYGGTGQSTFTTNGVIYGNTTSGLLVTAASLPGSNATTSYGILTTDINNVPVWTDVVDGGSY